MDGVKVEGKRCRLAGEVRVPGDKSISHRAVILSSIATGESVIKGLLWSDDVVRTVRAFGMMGVEMRGLYSGELRIKGRGLRGLREPKDVIDSGNSGTTLRLLAGLLSGQPFFSVLTGDSSLRRRPMDRVVIPLREMGARIWGREGDKKAPLAIKGGELRPISYNLPVASAQVKSAILLAGLYAEGVTEVVEPMPSRNHTEIMMRALGADLEVDGSVIRIRGGKDLRGSTLLIPGDVSSAAFFMVAALILPDSEIRIRDVGLNPTRTGVIDVLKKMGGDIEVENLRDWDGEPVGDVVVRSSSLHGVDIHRESVPRTIDEFPVICVAAAFAEGVTEISGAEELRVKESDRIATMASELRKFGVSVEEKEDGLIIEGGGRLRGASCSSHGDHRVAMALYVAALGAEGPTTIEGVECVDTSFPDFFSLMEGLCRGISS